VAVAHDVGPDDVGVHPARDLEAHHLPPEVAGREHELRVHLALAQDALRAVHVGQEEIQGGDPLHEPAFEPLPLPARHHARHEVEGEDPLRALGLAVDGEGDALVEELDVGLAPPLVEAGRAQAPELVVEGAVVGAHLPRRFEHLVEEGPRVVCTLEEPWLHPCLRPRLLPGRRAYVPSPGPGNAGGESPPFPVVMKDRVRACARG